MRYSRIRKDLETRMDTGSRQVMPKRSRRMGKSMLLSATLGAALLLAGVTAAPGTAWAQQQPEMKKVDGKAPVGGAPQQQPLPNSVLLFPAVIVGTDGKPVASTRGGDDAEAAITSALRNYLTKAGVGVVVYSQRLPSVQRAVSEATVRAETAAQGPGDDVRAAQQFAQLLGATEYLTATVENYKYDTQSRTATFNLSVERRSTEDGIALGASAEKATGAAAENVAGIRQEGSAVSRAADVVAEQSVLAVYPQSAATLNPPRAVEPKKKKLRGARNFLLPIIAVGAYLIAE